MNTEIQPEKTPETRSGEPPSRRRRRRLWLILGGGAAAGLAFFVLVGYLGCYQDFLFWEPDGYLQIQVTNRSSHVIRIERIRLGHYVGSSKALEPASNSVKITEFSDSYIVWTDLDLVPVEIDYILLDTGEKKHAKFTGDRRPRNSCFARMDVKDEGVTLSGCALRRSRDDIEVSVPFCAFATLFYFLDLIV